MVIIPILCVSLFEVIGQTVIGFARKLNNKTLLILATICYAFVVLFLYIANKYKTVGIINALWSGLSIILMLLVGHYFFGERLSIYEWVGIMFIFVGIGFITYQQK